MTTPTPVYTDGVIACRDMGNAELLAFIDIRRYNVSDADEAETILEHDRLRAGLNELSRRQRLYQAGRDVPSPRDTQYEAWRDVARQVRERADIAEVFADASYPLTRVGSNSRRGGDEYAGPCLLCGGHDRLRVWSGPNGRAWCRQCNHRADVIAITQTLLPNCHEWHAAVAYLARVTGVAMPNETLLPKPRSSRSVRAVPSAAPRTLRVREVHRG